MSEKTYYTKDSGLTWSTTPIKLKELTVLQKAQAVLASIEKLTSEADVIYNMRDVIEHLTLMDKMSVKMSGEDK